MPSLFPALQAFRHTARRLVLLAPLALAACGGGEVPPENKAQAWGDLQSAPTNPPPEFLQRKRQGVPLTPADASGQSAHANALFDWAEITFPAYFPSRSATLKEGSWLYRSYFATGVLLGVQGEDVYVQGGPFGASPVRVGRMSDYVPKPNSAPTADLAAATQVLVGGKVTLDASKSSDPERDALRYEWTLLSRPAGSQARIDNTVEALTSFTADVAGTYTVTLKVHDGQLSSSTVTATITAAAANLAPMASLRIPASAAVGQSITLDGSQSSDPNGDPLTYFWSLTAKPAGSAATVPSQTSSHSLAFTPDAAGSYTVSLVVSDGRINSTAATATVTVQKANAAPNAHAGSAQTVSAGSTVNLDGTGSRDPEGDTLTYSWVLVSRPAGSSASLSNALSARPSFVADVAGTYVASLVVSDGRLSSGTATVSITATAPSGLSALLGRVVFVYGFTGLSSSYSDIVTFRASDLTGTSLVGFTTAGKAVACGLMSSGSYQYFCLVRSSTGATDNFLFNLSNGRISGIYEFCLGSQSTSSCMQDFVISPDGVVVGSVEPTTAGGMARAKAVAFGPDLTESSKAAQDVPDRADANVDKQLVDALSKLNETLLPLFLRPGDRN